MKKQPKMTITPIQSNIDEEVSIVITGCEPNEELTLKAEMKDDRNEFYHSEATFLTNEDGEVDLAKTAPLRGTYDIVDVHGLFWSAKHQDKKYDDYFLKSNTKDLNIVIKLLIYQSIQDELTITRRFYQNKIQTTHINEREIIGTIYEPKIKGHYPNVMLLAGSDGGTLAPAASLLASKGYCVLDLAYFNQEGVPKNLENIPLEYFYKAIQLFKNYTQNEEKIALVGYSRGAELALLLASEYDEFSAVVAGAPSAYITSGLRNSIYAPINSWTLHNEAIPFLQFKHRAKTMFPLLKSWVLRKPASFLGIWDESIERIEDIEAERIKVERIRAPILLLSGENDQIWPATFFANLIEKKNPSLTEHINYADGGHFIAFPYALPSLPANIYEHVGGGMIMESGGTKQANALASTKSWPRIYGFLAKYARIKRHKATKIEIH